MLPQELKALPDHEQIILLENTKPIRCEKARYFKERAFMDRLKATSPALKGIRGLPSRMLLDHVAFETRLLAAPVPILDVKAHLAELARRKTPGTSQSIDLSRLDIDPAALPEITDQSDPSSEEIDRLVDTFFSLANVETEAVAFDTKATAASIILQEV